MNLSFCSSCSEPATQLFTNEGICADCLRIFEQQEQSISFESPGAEKILPLTSAQNKDMKIKISSSNS